MWCDGVSKLTPIPALQRSIQQRRCAPLLSARELWRYAAWKDIAAGNANVCLRPEAEVAIAKERTPNLD